ncbi:MAG: hypothetical protein AAGN66_24665 [Acidobacteriota bacterium]
MDQDAIREQILRYVAQRGDLDPADFAQVSVPLLCIWRTVESTYAFEGAGPSGRHGFTLGDFMTNLRRAYPELPATYGEPFCRTLMEQYLSLIERLPGGPSLSVDMARRLDQAVDDLIRSDLPSTELH